MKNSNHKYTMAIDLITSWANSLSTLKTDSLIIRNIYDPPIATIYTRSTNVTLRSIINIFEVKAT